MTSSSRRGRSVAYLGGLAPGSSFEGKKIALIFNVKNYAKI